MNDPFVKRLSRKLYAFLLIHDDAVSITELFGLAIIALVPLIFNPIGTYTYEPSKVFIFRALAVLGLFTAFWEKFDQVRQWKTLKDHIVNLLRYPLAVPIFFNTLTHIVVTAFSANPSLSFWGRCSKMYGAYTLLSYGAVWLMVTQYLHNKAQIHRIFTVVALTTLPITFYAILQWLHLDPIPWKENFGGRVFSTLAHPNILGAYMAMTLPMTFTLTFLASQRRFRLFWIVLLILQILTLLKTNSRGSFLAALAALFIWSLMVLIRKDWMKRVYKSRKTILGGGMILLLAIFIFLGANLEGLWFKKRLNTVASRLLIWGTSLKLASQRPVLGFGYDGFATAFQSVYPPALAHFEGYGVTPDRAHNFLLDTLVMSGIWGLTGLLGFWTMFYVKTFSYIRHLDDFPWFMMAIIASCTAYVVQGMFSFDVAALGSLTWILIGITAVLLKGIGSEKPAKLLLHSKTPQQHRLTLGRWVLLGIMFCIVLLSNIRFSIANIWRGQGQRLANRGDLFESAALYARATSLCPECTEDLARLASVFIRLFETTGEVAYLENAEDILHLAQQRTPNEAHSYVNLGNLYLLWGTIDPPKLDQAVVAYQQALELAPSYPQHYDYLGLAFQLKGDPEAAVRAFKEALTWDSLHVPTYVRLGMFYETQGETDLARIYFQSAIDAYSTWSTFDPGLSSTEVFRDELALAQAARKRIDGGTLNE